MAAQVIPFPNRSPKTNKQGEIILFPSAANNGGWGVERVWPNGKALFLGEWLSFAQAVAAAYKIARETGADFDDGGGHAA